MAAANTPTLIVIYHRDVGSLLHRSELNKCQLVSRRLYTIFTKFHSTSLPRRKFHSLELTVLLKIVRMYPHDCKNAA